MKKETEQTYQAYKERLDQFFSESAEPGTLYVIGTPIGNLSDLSPRVANILSQMDAIYAEDTRRVRTLLSCLNLHIPTRSHHAHNENKSAETMLERLKQGETLGLVSDAGLPCISDPGHVIIAACRQEQIPVHVVSGPTAGILGLVGSGLESTRFIFWGFLPHKGKKRSEEIEQIQNLRFTTLIYESPHRLLNTLEDFIASDMGSRKIVIAKELTKRFEGWITGTVQEAYTKLQEVEAILGEYVLILEGNTSIEKPTEAVDALPILKDLITSGMHLNEAVKVVAKDLKLNKNQLYQQTLEWKKGGII